ncbi:hypothetical protein Enr13x_74750 [Stieleria neptunia]|uniref:Uncharacterized protein n=1 Tax=Stieleria neptunia TaxID=2527979 RepID=A0A518I385_9BACT|nr:hypothetical protein Enr13x_74750 [Stieleria neptunia]
MTNHHKTNCTVCGKSFSMSDLRPGRFVRPLMADRISADHPEWNADAYICHGDLNHYRSQYVQNVLASLVEYPSRIDPVAQRVGDDERDRLVDGKMT